MSRRKTTYKGEGTRSVPLVTPKTPNQTALLRALKNSQQIFCTGPAGTGKTYVSVSYAAWLYGNRLIDNITITRPNVGSGKTLGAFPGTLEEKMDPWLRPISNVLIQKLGVGAVQTGIKNGNIVIAPFETMRGSSFENTFVILDEAQNTTREQMKMFLTRLGDNSVMFINGDVMQSDINEASGLSHAIHMVKKYKLPCPIIEFTVDDIVRSDLCKQWIISYLNEEKKN